MDVSSNGKRRNFLLDIYDKKYKSLMIISILMLLFSFGVISYQFITTGDFVNKGITLKGGLTLTVDTDYPVNPDELQEHLSRIYPKTDVNVRSFGELGSYGFVVEASDLSEDEIVSALKDKFPDLTESQYSSETTGPALGSAFFVQTLKAIFVAFVFMSLVVYLYFAHSLKLKWLASLLSIVAGTMMFYANTTIMYIVPLLLLAVLVVIYFKNNIPSFAIMLCAVSNIFFSLAIFNLVGLKLNTAGVAAFLMLVGYSIDTDILLSVRVLKRKDGLLFDRIVDAMKTGMMMTVSALIAVLTAYFLTSSAVIREIMFILAIGLLGDIIFTWVQNAGILRWHLEKKGWK